MTGFQLFIKNWLTFFFLLTPFFVLSMFTSVTSGWPLAKKKNLALRVTLSAYVTCLVLFAFGNWLFTMFGITIDSFRIGGGALLFLSAVGLVNSNVQETKVAGGDSEDSDIAVVPLAIPVIVGPGTTAALLVLGSEVHTVSGIINAFLSLTAAMLCLGGILYCATQLERLLGHKGISILTKLTGLVLAALAAQIIFTGVKAMLFGK